MRADLPPPSGFCRELAIRLTERRSITGTPDEASFGPWLAGFLRGLGRFGPDPEVWTFPAGPGDARHCVAMLVRGSGRATVLLTGHYDTVTVADYGDLARLATRPEALARALRARVADAAPGTAGARAHADLASGRFLPGRGLLDMKAGLAAGLTAMATFAEEAEATPGAALGASGPMAGARGNLLFLAVPDEENASAGARAAAAGLGDMAASRGLDLVAAINLDAIADDGDGTAGQVVALGTVGKVLPTAFVVGTPVHSGFPLRGLNAAVLAAAIAQRLEWAPELTDDGAREPGTPASLLSLRDGKAGYDVTTPGTAFATWSVLSARRDASGVLDVVHRLAREAVDACLSDLRRRAARSGQPAGAIAGPLEVPILRHGELLARVRERRPDAVAELKALAAAQAGAGASLPDVCAALTAALWERAGLPGPAVVLGLGSMPYLATHLACARLRAAVASLVADAPARHGTRLGTAEVFAGISDMSFLGQGDASAFARLAPDTPGWEAFVGLGEGSLAQLPTVNLGPWGRDYHTPLERIEADYGFRVLPALVGDLARRILAAYGDGAGE